MFPTILCLFKKKELTKQYRHQFAERCSLPRIFRNCGKSLRERPVPHKLYWLTLDFIIRTSRKTAKKKDEKILCQSEHLIILCFLSNVFFLLCCIADLIFFKCSAENTTTRLVQMMVLCSFYICSCTKLFHLQIKRATAGRCHERALAVGLMSQFLHALPHCFSKNNKFHGIQMCLLFMTANFQKHYFDKRNYLARRLVHSTK